jgi:Tfp pilus assembly protein PilF
VLLLIPCLLATAPLAAAAAADPGPTLAGVWTGPNGARLELQQDGAKVIGTLAGEGGPCPLPAGTEVLRGGVLDDSLSAMVRVCLVAPACGVDEGQALAILLVTRQLTGGVHAKAGCAAEVKSLVLRRPGAATAVVAPPVDLRLASTPPPPPPAPGARPPQVGTGHTEIAAQGGKLEGASVPGRAPDDTPPGQIPGRPVGGEHQPGYDPRDARQPTSVRGVSDKLLRKGQALLGTGEFEKARKVFKEALQKEPTRAEAYNGVGVSFYGRLDYAEALAWYKRALEADPRFGDAYYNMACIYSLQGHKQLAFRYLRLAALNHYSERQQLEDDPDLEPLRGDPEMREILEQMSAEARPSGAARP